MFLDLFKKNIFLLRVYHCTIYVVNSDAAYSGEETINKIKLPSLPIKSLLLHIRHAFVMCYSHLEKHCHSSLTMCMYICMYVCMYVCMYTYV